MESIKRKSNPTLIPKRSYESNKRIIKTNHRWLTLGSKNFRQTLICHHCKWTDKNKVDHNLFLICDQLMSRKDDWLNKFKVLLDILKTNTNITEDIIEEVHNYYNQTMLIKNDNSKVIENQNRIQ